jgi:mono/diheme cytochrome c family protein
MNAPRVSVVVLLLGSSICALVGAGQVQKSDLAFSPVIPRTWNDQTVASFELPLASTGVPPEHISSDYYYRMPVRPIYKSYSIYAPGREPAGYVEQLKQREPEIVFDPATLKTEADWIRAGQLAFEAPIAYDSDPIALGLLTSSGVRDPAWYQKVGVQVTNEGVMPYARYVIRKKGTVEVGNLACAMCHTRVMPDGSVIKGAQGNFPFDRALAFGARADAQPEQRLKLERGFLQLLFGTPWLRPDPLAQIAQTSLDALMSIYEAIPPGVLARQGSSPLHPVQVPDLIGIKDRRYLDRTGLVRHRDIGDLMRYGALNQDADVLARYAGFRPVEVVSGGTLPDPATLGRYSDEQLYALASYAYSLTPPPNPNRSDALAARGQKVFEREGCAGCHTPPLYTNNTLTPVAGFKPPADHAATGDILSVSVGTDPNLALRTRRGTGYYKVPSLKGVWYRGPFEHNGSVATLEDWFDPLRLRDDYVPTGFKGYGMPTRAVKGHEFGLRLSGEDKRALIVFLKTL